MFPESFDAASQQRMARPREPRSRSEMEAEVRRVAEPYVHRISRIWMIHSKTVIFLAGGEWQVEQRISDEWQSEVELIRREMEMAITVQLGAAHWPSGADEQRGEKPS